MTSHDNGVGTPCKIFAHRTADYWAIPPRFYKSRPATQPTFAPGGNIITGSVRVYDDQGRLVMVESKLSTVVCSHPDHEENAIWAGDTQFDDFDPDDGYSWRTDAKYVDRLYALQQQREEEQQRRIEEKINKEREEQENEEQANKIVDEVLRSQDDAGQNESEPQPTPQVRKKKMVSDSKAAFDEAVSNSEAVDELPVTERAGKFDNLIARVLTEPGAWRKVDGTVVSAIPAATTIKKKYGAEPLEFQGELYQISAKAAGTGKPKDLYVRADVVVDEG